ncbi:hypothetical protein [Sphingomonas turrisvirgatae]|uniref:Uncharacterized protein n=1 Tax=Sphingomonas turrisvirgatae TaxID=1888892 RepID=A0A1E3M1Q0_9SPHN|nr:hypothetical protein [Sphingomonas turrisvirgatae]ODP39285.1 hypothetical protein BFL28_10755 [Sphingomonas turrisvirgatae]
MATAAQLELVDDQPSTDIAVVVSQTPAVVLVDQQKRDDLYAHIRREIEVFTPDVTTPKGRDAIKSFAYKITRTKTAIDAAGKQLNEEARAKIAVVDEARRDARNTLDIMAEQVRKPLTEWEDAEKTRVARCREIIDAFKADAVVTLDDTAATVRARGMALFAVELAEDEFRDMLPEAQSAKDAAVETLRTALARLTKEEADRAELERLRAEAEERAEQDRMANEAAEREAREAEEARIAEERRVQAEKDEAERLARIEREAAERAKREAEDAARAEQERRDREHAEQLAAERRRAEDAERAAQAERDRIAAEEAARQAEAKRIADEQERRNRDQAHRTAVKTAAKQALMTCGADEETARKIVVAIIAGEVPNVSLEF